MNVYETKRRETNRLECLNLAIQVSSCYELTETTIARARAFAEFVTGTDDAVRELKQRVTGALEEPSVVKKKKPVKSAFDDDEFES